MPEAIRFCCLFAALMFGLTESGIALIDKLGGRAHTLYLVSFGKMALVGIRK